MITANLNLDQNKKIILNFPVKHGESEIRELSLRRPKAKELKNMNFTDLEKFDKIIPLVAQISNLPISVIEDLDFADMISCVRVLSDFLKILEDIP